eukprot:9069440-Pyramimonas_sp.AAC.1
MRVETGSVDVHACGGEPVSERVLGGRGVELCWGPAPESSSVGFPVPASDVADADGGVQGFCMIEGLLDVVHCGS